MLCSSSWERENVTERIPQTPRSVKKEDLSAGAGAHNGEYHSPWRTLQRSSLRLEQQPWEEPTGGEEGLRELPHMGTCAGTVPSQRVSPWYGPILVQCLKSHSLSVQSSSGTSSHRRNFTCGRGQELPWWQRQSVMNWPQSPFLVLLYHSGGEGRGGWIGRKCF